MSPSLVCRAAFPAWNLGMLSAALSPTCLSLVSQLVSRFCLPRQYHTLCLSLCLPLCLPLCLNLCTWLCLPACLSDCLRFCLPLCPPPCLSLDFSLCLRFVCLLLSHLSATGLPLCCPCLSCAPPLSPGLVFTLSPALSRSLSLSDSLLLPLLLCFPARFPPSSLSPLCVPACLGFFVFYYFTTSPALSVYHSVSHFFPALSFTLSEG